ncbi:MAG: hypothetical protein QOC61_1050 [Acidobacteriota bacterium]|jgi:F0F1-type ATP synthase membrane subunit c/vacuolar-type H+-ATPase subunit K|nr:hypothetical protein [Acidobacteriota bacterium]
MMNQSGTDAFFAARLRTMRILWGSFLMTVVIYALIGYFAMPSAELREAVPENTSLLYGLAAAGLAAVFASFVAKKIFYSRAAAQQLPAQVQVGFIIAVALCETSVLFGLLGLFITWNLYAYLLFALGSLGMILHFPRREQLLAACYKTTG